jgi:hypothetical protein
MDVHLTDEQAGALRELLDEAVRNLSYEIAATDNWHYKDQLRTNRQMLRDVLAQLDAPAADRPG